MERKIKVFVVEDQEIYRKGLIMVLSKIADIEIVGEASNGQEFLSKFEFAKPDIVLMDIRMPVMDGIEATEKAIQIMPDIKIIAISMFGEEENLQKLIAAGGFGFLLKNCSVKEIDHAIHSVFQGKNSFSEELLSYFTKKYLQKSHSEEDEIALTDREIEVLSLVAKGLDNAEIAEIMHISHRTVEGHKTRMIMKTGSKNIIDLLIYSIKKGRITV